VFTIKPADPGPLTIISLVIRKGLETLKSPSPSWATLSQHHALIHRLCSLVVSTFTFLHNWRRVTKLVLGASHLLKHHPSFRKYNMAKACELHPTKAQLLSLMSVAASMLRRLGLICIQATFLQLEILDKEVSAPGHPKLLVEHDLGSILHTVCFMCKICASWHGNPRLRWHLRCD
jgi:hypothetical protein